MAISLAKTSHITLSKTGQKRFSVDHSLKTMRSAGVAPRPSPAPARVVHTPQANWIQRAIAAVVAMFRRAAEPQPVPAPVIEAPAAPVPAPRMAATPTHYRAFSLLQPRITDDDADGWDVRAHKSIVAFRDRAKAIKDLKDPEIAAAACAVLDTFVEAVDAFIPLWDAAGKSEGLIVFEIGEGGRVRLHAEILETVAMLDAELARTLSGQSVSRDRFDTVQRYVETRYGGPTETYGLGPVD